MMIDEVKITSRIYHECHEVLLKSFGNGVTVFGADLRGVHALRLDRGSHVLCCHLPQFQKPREFE